MRSNVYACAPYHIGGGIRALSLYYGRDTTYTTRSWETALALELVKGEVDLLNGVDPDLLTCELLNREYDIIG